MAPTWLERRRERRRKRKRLEEVAAWFIVPVVLLFAWWIGSEVWSFVREPAMTFLRSAQTPQQP